MNREQVFSTDELFRFRQETPGCAHRIHLNNSGASLMPLPVLEAIDDYLQLESEIGGYEAMEARQRDILDFYSVVARLLQTQAKNIAYTNNATDSFARAMASIPFEKDDLILTTRNDYSSYQIGFMAYQKRFGIRYQFAPDLPEGGVDPDAMGKMIRQLRPRLVCVAEMPTNSGLIQEVESIGRVCREEGIWYLVDSCQTAGQRPLDVGRMQCDFLCGTMRKFMRGPRGGGFLYVSDRALQAGLEPLMIDQAGATWTEDKAYELREDARRFEDWETSYALMMGSRAAIEYALAIGLDRIQTRVTALAAYCRERLSAIEGLRVLDRGNQLGGIVTAHVPDIKPPRIKVALRKAGINASFQQTANALLDFREKGVGWALRLSPHYFNTYEEVGKAADVLEDFLGKR